MNLCLFVSDLHGSESRYRKLFAAIRDERPSGVFLGGDLLPLGLGGRDDPAGPDVGFLQGFLVPELQRIRRDMGEQYPRVFVILGNDDRRAEEEKVLMANGEVWTYAHERKAPFGEFEVYGYSYVPPTPFQLKDWERYDVSRSVDPGCVSPEEGRRSTPVDEAEARYGTIEKDLDALAGEGSLERAIFLFHTPPYRSLLDRAALDGHVVDAVPVDVHVGSIAVARFIERRKPRVTLHGHIHEAPRLTGTWRTRIGATHAFSAAHDGPELALVRFDPEEPEKATRELL
ncbi:MAG: hypothetical protein GF346_09500 [Candidatus Eisenbacteria bacterium]|nr:hypothetical protein [Candidatus Latescibacterota bacterium]MBD3302667.1 hypothetical protein [Candidatus Eisenbacteria bacterium]